MNMKIYTDDDLEWEKIGDSVLPIELASWADIMDIAPLSADIVAKVINQCYYIYSLYISLLI